MRNIYSEDKNILFNTFISALITQSEIKPEYLHSVAIIFFEEKPLYQVIDYQSQKIFCIKKGSRINENLFLKIHL
ncbi:hypothetical protein CK503_09350 [Aliifodinibius salipaludis]|uniref:Uncharacterized protein n=1 Tax=Fodinibius salipaludis TaxID=2032627 RepID=A0A2A2G988_9BACT|nr:hypothetical protein CK503_09350 [Aliifodinibius salipaludis]